MNIREIYQGAERFINQFLRKEMADQGHRLTGAMEDSLDGKQSKQGNADAMDGFAVYYTKYVNEGVPPESASWKQFPFLVKYFEQRGFPYYSRTGPDARSLAAATIKTWMKEGMSTQASKRFSTTGSRQNMIGNAFVGNSAKVDEYMKNSFDFAVEEKFQSTKSETI